MVGLPAELGKSRDGTNAPADRRGGGHPVVDDPDVESRDAAKGHARGADLLRVDIRALREIRDGLSDLVEHSPHAGPALDQHHVRLRVDGRTAAVEAALRHGERDEAPTSEFARPTEHAVVRPAGAGSGPLARAELLGDHGVAGAAAAVQANDCRQAAARVGGAHDEGRNALAVKGFPVEILDRHSAGGLLGADHRLHARRLEWRLEQVSEGLTGNLLTQGGGGQGAEQSEADDRG